MDNDSTKEAGYSSEEKYFYEKNKELIEKKRKELDEQRNSLILEKEKEAYWMRCPKCGDAMKEESLIGIMIDRCPKCNGIYFDNGELETLLDSTDRGGFFSSMKKLFNNN